ncbi:DUF6207 family protein [Streptomyces sp. NPDC048350]|uniref:DUF6207 family protein n=1 Tax=Streptomyces sp. NPDC048350 TaxID=3365538 RepID=UPI00371721B1
MDPIDEVHVCEPGLAVLDVSAYDAQQAARAVMPVPEKVWTATPGTAGVQVRIYVRATPPPTHSSSSASLLR